MWLFSEMSLERVSFFSGIANAVFLVSLVVGVAAMYFVFVTAGIKERHWDELRRQSDEQIAASNERAAAAESKAAEAELELIEFRKPRHVDAEQAELIIQRIKPFAGAKYDVGHSLDDRESMDFLWNLEPILPKAGWVHIDWDGGYVFTKPNWPGDHVYGRIGVINVSIEIHPQSHDKLLPVAEALVGVLNEIGIAATVAAFNNSSTNTDAIHLLVGPKR